MQAELKRAFAARGLLLDPTRYDRIRTRAREWGLRERDRLQTVLGDDWVAVLTADAAGLAPRDVIRTLGFGRVLTAFLAAPAAPVEDTERVLRLGARMNALVAAFDDLVDHGHHPAAVLSRATQRAAIDTARGPAGVGERGDTARERVLYRLLATHLDDLRRLPYVADRGPVRSDVVSYVDRMFEAERASVTGQDGPAVNGETSVYPVTVLGLPAWLATGTYDRARYRTHVGWLHAVGSLVGLVDDAVDLREDAEAGAYNAVGARLAEQSPAAVADRLADRTARELARWRALLADATAESRPETVDRLRDRFAFVLTSWVGGPNSAPPRPRE